MTDRYRQALEGLRERCAQEAERITARRRTVAAMTNNEAVKPCEVAAAIRKIDVQQHYECAAREIEWLRAMLQRAFQRGYPSGARVREMYDAVQAVKRQDAWGNTQLTSALLAAEERAEKAEAEIQLLLAEKERLLEALDTARDFVAEALARERDAYRGHESVSSIADIERYLAQIDAALAQGEANAE